VAADSWRRCRPRHGTFRHSTSGSKHRQAFHLAVEPNTCSLEIGLASEWTRADVRLLAVFSDKETELFFRIPIPNRTYDLILLRERDLGLVEINQPDLMFRCVYRNPSQCVFTQG
jgi:hypothetical protein